MLYIVVIVYVVAVRVCVVGVWYVTMLLVLGWLVVVFLNWGYGFVFLHRRALAVVHRALFWWFFELRGVF